MNPPPRPELVDELEPELERAIADVVDRLELPIGPDKRTMHLMAKAATAVYEAAVHISGK